MSLQEQGRRWEPFDSGQGASYSQPSAPTSEPGSMKPAQHREGGRGGRRPGAPEGLPMRRGQPPGRSACHRKCPSTHFLDDCNLLVFEICFCSLLPFLWDKPFFWCGGTC